MAATPRYPKPIVAPPSFNRPRQPGHPNRDARTAYAGGKPCSQYVPFGFANISRASSRALLSSKEKQGSLLNEPSPQARRAPLAADGGWPYPPGPDKPIGC